MLVLYRPAQKSLKCNIEIKIGRIKLREKDNRKTTNAFHRIRNIKTFLINLQADLLVKLIMIN